MLAISNLSKNFGGLRVTDDVSLNVMPGELHAVIGPNGAGKTTLIHQISGSLAPGGGAIELDGADVTGLSTAERAQRGMARSFQITSILPSFTALANVALAAQAKSGSSFRFWRPVADEHVLNEPALAVLETTGIATRAHVPAGLLSHGEKRALELAMALVGAPKLLLLDEPMAGMGHDESRQLVAVLAALKRRYAILLVEHDMQAVFALADRISVLVAGKIIATGMPDAIRRDAGVRAAYLGDEELV